MKDDYPEQDAGRWERYAGGTARKRVTGKDGEEIYQFRTTVPRIPVGDARKAAVAAVAPRRQQTLDDLEFSLGSKQTMQDALNELSADEISDMFRAMDKGPGVDVRSGRNKMAHDTMRMKRGVEAGGSVDETGALSFDYGELAGGPNQQMLRAMMRSRDVFRNMGLRRQFPEAVKAAEAQLGEESVGTLW